MEVASMVDKMRENRLRKKEETEVVRLIKNVR